MITSNESSGGLPGAYKGPGLVDIQLNGYAGFDFNALPDAWSIEQLFRVREALNRRGVVAAVPTFITDDVDRLIGRIKKYNELLEQEPHLEETFPRLHIEGPFITAEEGPRGAHPSEFCRTPNEAPDFLDRILEAGKGRIAILTLAPELPGAHELIERACKENIRVAIGHTCASAQVIREAVTAGATLSTHLGNGSHQTLPRLDNYVEAQLAIDELWATFIADGHHIPFYTLKNFLRAKTFERSILVTDAIAAADKGPGDYTLGGRKVMVDESLKTSQPGGTHLAGSALTLDRAVINVCVECGIPFEKAWKMASSTPAALIGIEGLRKITVTVSRQGFGVRS
jgi:N-acetylglucosamine-6-phosphate deacetylase